MQMKPRIQPCEPSVFDQVLSRPEGSKVLVAFPDCIVLAAAISAVCHEHGYLRAQFRELKRTFTVH